MKEIRRSRGENFNIYDLHLSFPFLSFPFSLWFDRGVDNSSIGKLDNGPVGVAIGRNLRP